jgi:hypothetical protein
MATRKFSADDIKLDTENIEYAGDLKQVDSAHAGDAATETIVVTEEDVSTAREIGFGARAHLFGYTLVGSTNQEGHRQKHPSYPCLGLLVANSGQVIAWLCVSLWSSSRCRK